MNIVCNLHKKKSDGSFEQFTCKIGQLTDRLNNGHNVEPVSYRFRISRKDERTGKTVTVSETIERPQGMTPADERDEVLRLSAEWAKRKKAELEAGEPIESKDAKALKKKTLQQLADEWFIRKSTSTKPLTPNGIHHYRYSFDIFIKHYGAEFRVSRITTASIRDFLSSLSTYSPQTRVHIFRSVNVLMKYAVKQKIIPVNPCDALDDDEKPTNPIRGVESDAFLDSGEAKEFLDTLEAHAPLFWRAFFTLLLFCGLRRGEALVNGGQPTQS